MSEHTVVLSWSRGDQEFSHRRYSRDHRLRFDGGAVVDASAAPAYDGDAARVDPEEAFVGALSSCYLLSFLAVAARRGLVVESYDDDPVGVLGRDAEGNVAMTRVTLRPRIAFGGDGPPEPAVLAAVHATARREWFMGNSVRAELAVEPREPRDGHS